MSFNRLSCGLVALLVFGAGCGPSNEFQPPPPPPVTVAQPVVMTVTNYLEETGTTEAVDRVEIRARVRGFLEKVDFEAGEDVAKGDMLFLIQQREFKAQVAAAKADVEAAKVELERAKIEYNRQQNLLKENATAETNVIAAKAEQDAAAAAVDVAAAALDQAELNLTYTEVTSPIDGRVGKTLVKLGNLVGSDGDTHLTTVISYDPIYANFNISEQSLLSIMEERGYKNEDQKESSKNAKILLSRGNDEGFPFNGTFNYADLAVDQSTGTYLIRAVFPNPDLKILPGLFVTVRVPIGVQENAVLVPERAVAADQAGRYVLVVNGENKVERRDVTPGIKQQGLVVVKGVRPEDWVIVEGLQKARPGAEVAPEKTELKADSDELESVQGSTGGPPPETPETPALPDDADASDDDTPAESEESGSEPAADGASADDADSAGSGGDPAPGDAEASDPGTTSDDANGEDTAGNAPADDTEST